MMTDEWRTCAQRWLRYHGVTWEGGDSRSWPPAAPCSAHCGWHEVPLRGGHRCGLGWTVLSWVRWSKVSVSTPVQSVWSAYEYECRKRSLGSFSSRFPLCLFRCPWTFQPVSVLLWGWRKDSENKTRETVGHKEREKNKSSVNITKRNNILDAILQPLFVQLMKRPLY